MVMPEVGGYVQIFFICKSVCVLTRLCVYMCMPTIFFLSISPCTGMYIIFTYYTYVFTKEQFKKMYVLTKSLFIFVENC